MSEARVWINGVITGPDDAHVRYDDHGVTVGDGVFETIKLARGVPFALDAHLDRLDRSVASLRLPPVDRSMLQGAIDEVAAGAEADGFLRITVTGGRGPLGSPRGDGATTVIVAIRPGEVRVDPTEAYLVDWTRNERGALAGVKSTSYAENVLALDVAVAAGASEALFANTVGNLCEGTGSNVFVVLDDELVTPPLAAGCLAGVTRALLIELLGSAVREADVAIDRMAEITEMFLVSTGREVQPVSVVRSGGGLVVPNSIEYRVDGPHTAAARAAWVAAYG